MAVQGGGNLLALFTINTLHNAIGTTPVIELSQTVGTTITRNDDGTVTIELDQITDSPDLSAFLETYIPAPTGAAPEEITFENGDKFGGATASSPDLLAIVYGGVDSGSNKRKVTLAVVKGANTSGSFSQTSGTYSRPSLSFSSQRILATNCTVNAQFKNTLVVPAATTLPLDSFAKTAWLDKA